MSSANQRLDFFQPNGEVLPNSAASKANLSAQDPEAFSICVDLGAFGGTRRARSRPRFSHCVCLSRRLEHNTCARGTCHNNLLTFPCRHSTSFHADVLSTSGLCYGENHLNCWMWEPGGGLCTCRPRSCRVVQAKISEDSQASILIRTQIISCLCCCPPPSRSLNLNCCLTVVFL